MLDAKQVGFGAKQCSGDLFALVPEDVALEQLQLLAQVPIVVGQLLYLSLQRLVGEAGIQVGFRHRDRVGSSRFHKEQYTEKPR
ncbi:MAG: hypothetical protein IPO40_07810 [Fibrobacteres bacterium]|nr:hypothetical protein [Fibrobacterota bacterium]